MAIYCNTLEGNMQYGDDPYCFTRAITTGKVTKVLALPLFAGQFWPGNFSQ